MNMNDLGVILQFAGFGAAGFAGYNWMRLGREQREAKSGKKSKGRQMTMVGDVLVPTIGSAILVAVGVMLAN